jgi:predicted nuclease of predicted toxin-antitoxin system
MRFLLDENADLRLAAHLRNLGHDVKSVVANYGYAVPDSRVLALAHQEQRILITNDKDFGELVFLHRQSHAGVILFRLPFGAALTTKLDRLDHVLTTYPDVLDQFLVVTQHRVRRRT